MSNKEIKLSAESRKEENGNINKIRSEGYIPAVIYGPDAENRNIKIKSVDFQRVFSEAGESHLIDLSVDGEAPIKAIVKDTQKDPIKDGIIHVDFYRVNMNKKITAEIPLRFVGESKAVKEMGGTLVKNMDSIEVKCLPGDLVDGIDVDLTSLDDFHAAIRVGDIGLPEGMEVLNEAEELIASVAEPAKEEAPQEQAEEEEESGEESEKKSDEADNKKNEEKSDE